MIAFSSESFDASFGRIRRLCRDGQLREALQLLHQMDQKGISISRDIFYHLLQVCAKKRDLSIARQLQSYRIARDLRSVTVLGDHLIRIFVSCGNLQEANEVFNSVPKPSVYTWNSIISAYIAFEEYERAIELHKQMQHSLTRPNEVTFLYVLKAYSCLNLSEQGMLLHCEITELGLDHDVTIASTLIDMYMKCGLLVKAQDVFDMLPSRDVNSWNALIAGYAKFKHGVEALRCFEYMQLEGVLPDSGTFVGVLVACCHVGLVEKGQTYLEIMTEDYGISPTTEHHTCMVSLLARAGHLDMALKMAAKMQSDSPPLIWDAMLTGCEKWGNMEVGRFAFENESKWIDKST